MKLNTSTWQEFKLSELFDMQNGFFNNKPETVSSSKGDGIIPFLGATAENNGITDYCDIESIKSSSRTGERDDTLSGKIFDGNCITITNDGSVCHAYYQFRKFSCSHSMTICVPKFELDSLIAMFICSVINKERYKWSYGRKLHDLKKAKNIVIKLPVKCNPDNTLFIDKNKTYSSNGYVPDWQFMEDYIKSLHYKPITTKVSANNKKSLEVDLWEEFKVSDIFNVKYGINMELNTCIETTYDDPDGIAFVARTSENNGVSAYVKMVDGKAPQPAETITVAGGGSVLSTFVQKRPFYSGRDLYLLIAKEDISLKAKMFLSTILSANQYRYSYGRQANKTLPCLILKLPIRRDNKGDPIIDNNYTYSNKGYVPDWQFMEDYIDSLPYSDRLPV